MKLIKTLCHETGMEYSPQLVMHGGLDAKLLGCLKNLY
jgi:hypothetical protein